MTTDEYWNGVRRGRQEALREIIKKKSAYGRQLADWIQEFIFEDNISVFHRGTGKYFKIEECCNYRGKITLFIGEVKRRKK